MWMEILLVLLLGDSTKRLTWKRWSTGEDPSWIVHLFFFFSADPTTRQNKAPLGSGTEHSRTNCEMLLADILLVACASIPRIKLKRQTTIWLLLKECTLHPVNHELKHVLRVLLHTFTDDMSTKPNQKLSVQLNLQGVHIRQPPCNRVTGLKFLRAA